MRTAIAARFASIMQLHSGRCVEHGDGSRFVAIAAFFINGPNTRKWSGRVANGLHLLTQGQLIVFELNDQMCVRGGGGFEGFF